MRTAVIQLRQRGIITLPAKLRARYNLETGDTLTMIDLDGVFVLASKVSIVPKLVAEIERLRKKEGLSVEDLLTGLEEQRQLYYREKYGENS